VIAIVRILCLILSLVGGIVDDRSRGFDTFYRDAVCRRCPIAHIFPFFSFSLYDACDVSKDAKRLRHPVEEILHCSISPRTIGHLSRANVCRPPPLSPFLLPQSEARRKAYALSRNSRAFRDPARSTVIFSPVKVFPYRPPSRAGYLPRRRNARHPPRLAHPPNDPPMQNVRVQAARPPGLADLTAVRPPQAEARTRPLHVAWIGGGCRPKG